MIRLLRVGLARFGGIPPRRQNFFQLNPVFPDQGQKDFDIYNVDYNHILSGTLATSDETRYQKVKEKLTREVYLGPILEKTYDMNRGEYDIDEETGFPIGIHEDFDNFIQIFKREKKVGSNIIGQFQDLVMTLMKKFNAKSELQLIKIFRMNLANSKKQSFKDKIRSLLINSAFIRFIKERKNQGLENEDLKLEEIESFMSGGKTDLKRQGEQISKKQLQEAVFRSALKELDGKIIALEQQIQKKALANGTFVPSYHPKFGQAITEQFQTNLNYDLNFSRGFRTQQTSTQPGHTPNEIQDRYIESRVNRLFFMRALEQIQQKQEVSPERLITAYDLPINIRSNDKMINALLHKYKEYDLIIEPDMKDIYSEIDIALKRVSVKVVPNYLQNEAENKLGAGTESQVKERMVSKDVLLWRRLNVEEIFDAERYEEEQVDKVKVQQKEIAELSPSAVLELSLNKMPFNLYRHADLDKFGVFNKYRKKIYKDYITDRVVDPEIEFKFFSLQQAQKKLQKIKKPQQVPDRFYGHATRKSSEAEVFVVKGTGKVVINKEPLADYCGDVYHRGQALKPLIFTQTAGQFDLEFTVVGGGVHSQAECMAMALTKALIMVNPRYEQILARFGLVGADDRRNEAKKLGLYTARVRPPYVRR